MLTDDAGAVVWGASYRPFGEATVTGSVAFNLRFPGQYHDAETGLHYNMMRDYDSGLGRYVQSDPIGLSAGWNTYAYVGGNPVMRVDPRGLESGPEEFLLEGCAPAIAIFSSWKLWLNWKVVIEHGAMGEELPSLQIDKYAHCMANCESAEFSETQENCARLISDLNEWADETFFGASPGDVAADQTANEFGRAIGRRIRESDNECEETCCEDECKKRYY